MNARLTPTDASLDGTVATVLISVSVVVALALLIGMAVIVFRNNKPEQTAPEPEQQHPCDVSVCPYPGWIPVTRRNTGERVLVCRGDYLQGQLRGWWTS